MSVEVSVILPDLLKEIVGTTRFKVRASSLGDALCKMRALYPVLDDHLFASGSGFRPHVLCLINGENTREMGSHEILLEAGDTITFHQAISGG